MSLTSDCIELPDHLVEACNDYKKGGISAVAIIDSSAIITDFTSQADWQTAIDAGTVKIIKNIKAIFPKGNPVEGENVVACGADKILDGFDGTVTWKDFNVNPDNDAFYAVLNKSKGKYVALYYCVENEIRIIAPLQGFTFAISWATAPESNKEKQMYDASGSFFAPVGYYPTLYTAPPVIFN